jgi:hypothetical protein
MTAPAWAPSFGDVGIQGDSSQNVVGATVTGTLVQTMNTFIRKTPSMYLGSAEIAERMAGYVAAGNHELIVSELGISHAVVLAGPRGSGRETTAIAAIRQLRPGVAIRRFSLEAEDSEEIRVKGEGYLVRADDGELDRLGACVDAVQASGGYLVVIAETPEVATSALLQSIVIEPPHPVHVYRRRMLQLGRTEWQHWDGAPALLEEARPADARRLADITEEIAKRGGELTTQRAEVTSAYRDWRDELRDWFAAHSGPDERALFVAAAALSPAEEAHIYTVAYSLARRLEITLNGAGLAWCPVTNLRELLGVAPDEERIVFRRHGFTRSALNHTLADYPLARSALLHWLADLPTEDAVPSALREPLAVTFADLAAEHGPAELIIATARRWGTGDLADLAFIALSRTCLHPRVGGPVRRALYKWSRTAGTPQTLKLVIARVCEPLGQTYPSVALTRLKHVATHGNAQVLAEVIVAAQALSGSGHHPEVLAAALGWCAETNVERLSAAARRGRRRAGATLFLALAMPVTESGLPEVLNGQPGVDPLRYVPGWRAVLDFCTTDTCFLLVVRRWLDAALRHLRVRAWIVEVFVEAAQPSTTRPGTTYRTGPVESGLITAEVMIDVVRLWAALDRTDPIRKQVKEAIILPLTRPWWVRLLKVGYVRLRTLIQLARESRRAT